MSLAVLVERARGSRNKSSARRESETRAPGRERRLRGRDRLRRPPRRTRSRPRPSAARSPGCRPGRCDPTCPATGLPPIQWLIGLTAVGASCSVVGHARGHCSVALGSGDGDRRVEQRAGPADRRGREGVRPPFVVGAGRGQPDPGRRRRGPLLLGLRRQALPRLRVAARQPLARPPASEAVAAIKEQADKLCTIGPPMATEPRSTLARLLAEVTPGDLAMSFFTNGGAEANENAIKLARWYTGPPQGDRALPLVPRRDGGRDHAHRRPAPLARRAGHPGRGAHVRPVHVSLPRRPSRPVPGVHRRAAPRGDPPVRGRRTTSPP